MRWGERTHARARESEGQRKKEGGREREGGGREREKKLTNSLGREIKGSRTRLRDRERAHELAACLPQRTKELVAMYKDREFAGPAHRCELPEKDDEDERPARVGESKEEGRPGAFTGMAEEERRRGWRRWWL